MIKVLVSKLHFPHPPLSKEQYIKLNALINIKLGHFGGFTVEVVQSVVVNPCDSGISQNFILQNK